MKARNAFEKGLQRLAKHDPVGSLTQFERATTGFPDYYEAYYHIGVADLRLGREEEAAQAFQTAIVLSRGRYVWAQFALGLLLCRRGNTPSRDRHPPWTGRRWEFGHRSSLLEPHPFSPEPS